MVLGTREGGLRELAPTLHHVCLGFIVYIIIVIRSMASTPDPQPIPLSDAASPNHKG